MGIEYVAIVGIFLLILSATTSFQASKPAAPEAPPSPGGPSCGQSCSTCPNGAVVCCSNYAEGGQCVSCSPDCSGQQAAGGGESVPAGSPPGPSGQTTTDAGSAATTTKPGLNVTVIRPTALIAEDVKYTLNTETRVLKIEEKIEGLLQISELEEEYTVEIPVERKTQGGARLEFLSEQKNEDVEIKIVEAGPVLRSRLSNDFDRINKTVFTAFELNTSITADGKIFFTVNGTWISENAGSPDMVVLSQLNPDMSFKYNLPTKLTFISHEPDRRVKTASYQAELPRSFSLFVINARKIVSAPALCNGDSICQPPSENSVTCPADCPLITGETKCQEGESICIGDTVYRCVSDKFLKSEVCSLGCDSGQCLSQAPPANTQNTILIITVTALIVMALAAALVFLRKP